MELRLQPLAICNFEVASVSVSMIEQKCQSISNMVVVRAKLDCMGSKLSDMQPLNGKHLPSQRPSPQTQVQMAHCVACCRPLGMAGRTLRKFLVIIFGMYRDCCLHTCAEICWSGIRAGHSKTYPLQPPSLEQMEGGNRTMPCSIFACCPALTNRTCSWTVNWSHPMLANPDQGVLIYCGPSWASLSYPFKLSILFDMHNRLPWRTTIRGLLQVAQSL